MEIMYQAIAENARHRYDYLDDSEITLNTLMDFKRVLQAIQGSYKTETLSSLLSYFIINSSVSKREKGEIAEEVGRIIATLDALNSHSDTLTLLQCAIEQELD